MTRSPRRSGADVIKIGTELSRPPIELPAPNDDMSAMHLNRQPQQAQREPYCSRPRGDAQAGRVGRRLRAQTARRGQRASACYETLRQRNSRRSMGSGRGTGRTGRTGLPWLTTTCCRRGAQVVGNGPRFYPTVIIDKSAAMYWPRPSPWHCTSERTGSARKPAGRCSRPFSRSITSSTCGAAR